MIDYGAFRFAAAPRTGSTWALKMLHEAGFRGGSKALLHTPGPPSPHYFSLSLIRHPCEWLCSYWSLRGGQCGVPEIDKLMTLSRESSNLDEFVSKYLEEMPGQVGVVFESYRADSYIKTSHLREGFTEFLISMRVPWKKAREAVLLGPQNVSPSRAGLSRSLWDRVIKAEERLVEHFEF